MPSLEFRLPSAWSVRAAATQRQRRQLDGGAVITGQLLTQRSVAELQLANFNSLLGGFGSHLRQLGLQRARRISDGFLLPLVQLSDDLGDHLRHELPFGGNGRADAQVQIDGRGLGTAPRMPVFSLEPLLLLLQLASVALVARLKRLRHGFSERVLISRWSHLFEIFLFAPLLLRCFASLQRGSGAGQNALAFFVAVPAHGVTTLLL